MYETGFIQGISQEVIVKQTFSILHWPVIDLLTPKRQKNVKFSNPELGKVVKMGKSREVSQIS